MNFARKSSWIRRQSEKLWSSTYPFQVPEGRILHSSAFKGGDLLPPGQVQDPCLQRRLDCRPLSCVCYARRRKSDRQKFSKHWGSDCQKATCCFAHSEKDRKPRRCFASSAGKCSLWQTDPGASLQSCSPVFLSLSFSRCTTWTIFGRLDSMQIQTKNGPWSETPPHSFLELEVRVER